MQETGLPRTGGCQCGSVRYELWDDPEAVHVCHCTECRKQSASAFGISVIVRAAAFRLISGSPRQWTRLTDKGHALECWFCPECGVRLYHVSSGFPDFRSVRGGTLDVPPDLSQAAHVYTDHMLDGVTVPEGALSFPLSVPD